MAVFVLNILAACYIVWDLRFRRFFFIQTAHYDRMVLFGCPILSRSLAGTPPPSPARLGRLNMVVERLNSFAHQTLYRSGSLSTPCEVLLHYPMFPQGLLYAPIVYGVEGGGPDLLRMHIACHIMSWGWDLIAHQVETDDDVCCFFIWSNPSQAHIPLGT